MTTTTLEKFRTVTLAGVEFHVDRHGFPVETCGRCGGCGEYSYCERFGTRCFGCSGSGVTYASKIPAVEHGAWKDADRHARETVGWRMQAGDRIRRWGRTKTNADDPRFAWREVASVERGRATGWQGSGDDKVEISWRSTITFVDGEVLEVGGEIWVRDARVDPAPYVARAQAAMVRKLQRRR
jgi:hypothetical protein